MANKRMTTPTQTANIASSVVVSLIIVLMGVLMILSGFGVIPVDIKIFWAPALLFALSACSLTVGIFRKDTLFVWLAIVLAVCGIPVLCNIAADVSYGASYPLFIAAPAVASLAAVFFADNKKLHLQSLILFGGLAVIFMLQSLKLIPNWWIIAGIAVVMVGLFFFVAVATSRRGRWDDGDRPQRQRGRKWDDGDEHGRNKPQPPKEDDEKDQK